MEAAKKGINRCPINVNIEWVKAHKSNKYNQAADKLAKQSAKMPLIDLFVIAKPLKNGLIEAQNVAVSQLSGKK